MRSQRLYLMDILDCIGKIKSITKNMDRAVFLSDYIIQDAVLRNVSIIGEASNHLDDDVRQSMPEIEWSEIVGLRNIVVHDYFGVDLKLVWNIISMELDPLEDAILEYLDKDELP